MNKSSIMAFKAVHAQLEAERDTARAILQNYWDNPAAIGEHPNLPEEIYKALCAYTEACDRIKALTELGVGTTAEPIRLN